MFAHGETATRLRAPLKAGRYSAKSTERDWTNAAELDLPHVAFDPGSSSEPTADGRSSVITTPTLYDTTFSDVQAGDRIRVRGRTYDVEGHPAQWRNSPFSGWSPGQVISLKEVAG